MRWTMGEWTGHLLAPAQTAWLKSRYEGYKRGEVSELAICGEMVQVYHGLRTPLCAPPPPSSSAATSSPTSSPRCWNSSPRLQAAGTDIWAVSSTCDWVIEEGVQRFHIPANRVLAARVECANGLATDRLLDVPTDEGKVASLHRVGITAPDAVFGNSVHDAAMLAIAQAERNQRSLCRQSAADLLRRAAADGWPVYFPRPSLPAQIRQIAIRVSRSVYT